MRNVALILLSFAFISCQGSIYQIRKMTPEELTKVSTNALVGVVVHEARFDVDPAPNVRQELKSREVISEREWQLIEEKKIMVGMHELALYMSWGLPVKTNKLVGPSGCLKQCIYEPWPRMYPMYATHTYVYVRNGIVESWYEFHW